MGVIISESVNIYSTRRSDTNVVLSLPGLEYNDNLIVPSKSILDGIVAIYSISFHTFLAFVMLFTSFIETYAVDSLFTHTHFDITISKVWGLLN